MEVKDKLKAFEDETILIKDEKRRAWAKWAIGELPDYFFTIPASSAGKYHPQYALGEGGLVRHTKAAVRIAYTLLGLEMFGKYTSDQKDMILTALILHDGAKSGIPKSTYTTVDHPVVICDHLRKAYDNLEDKIILPDLAEDVYRLILPHMGQWNTDRSGKVLMPKPESGAEAFVHMCDYLASRKMLEFNFEATI